MRSNISAIAVVLAATSLHAALPYTVVDSGQTKCYDNFKPIAPPPPGQPFYGQDAQFHAHPAGYTLAADGLTVHDTVTGLTWQRSPDTDGNGVLNRNDKLTLAGAKALPAKLNAAKHGGFDDWRLPSIKELYSLFNAGGIDPSGPAATDTSALTPFIDTRFFKFAGRQRPMPDSKAARPRWLSRSVGRRVGCQPVPWPAGRPDDADRAAADRHSGHWAQCHQARVAATITSRTFTAPVRSAAIQRWGIRRSSRMAAARRAMSSASPTLSAASAPRRLRLITPRADNVRNMATTRCFARCRALASYHLWQILLAS